MDLNGCYTCARLTGDRPYNVTAGRFNSLPSALTLGGLAAIALPETERHRRGEARLDSEDDIIIMDIGNDEKELLFRGGCGSQRGSLLLTQASLFYPPLTEKSGDKSVRSKSRQGDECL